MPNFRTTPAALAMTGDVTVYHAMPHGLRDPLGRRVAPGLFINTSRTHPTKRQALAAHASQKAWLDASQGMDSYLKMMDDLSQEVGRMSQQFEHAEGWRRHSHLGFCGPEADPLRAVLGQSCLVNESYQKSLEQPI
jgi:hypothetical protein